MPCSVIRLADGTTAIVKHGKAYSPPCRFCNGRHKATLLCDFVIGKTLGGAPITCDAKVCSKCARSTDGLDICPKHPAGALGVDAIPKKAG